jgi:hypothetical protein
MKKILFDAHTPYQLMVAVAISYKYYRSDFTVIIIGDALFKNSDNLKVNIEKTNIFNQVEVSNDRVSKEELIEQINDFNLDDVDIFHFSSYSAASSCYLYNMLVKKAKLILNEEGVATYDLYNKYNEYKELFPSKKREDVDLGALSEIWVFNQLLYTSNSKEKIREINLRDMRDETFLIESLNIIFDYQYKKIKEKNIFFTQNFLDYGVVTADEVEDFFRNIKQVYHDDFILKLHPFDNNIEIYKRLNIKVLLDDKQVPWELIVLNHLEKNAFDKKVLITVSSTSLSAFHLFLKYKVCDDKSQYILMTKLFQTPFNEASENYYNRLAECSDFDYKIVNSYDEL